MSEHVGFGTPGLHTETANDDVLESTNPDVPDEEQEHSRIPSFGVGTGHSSAKSGGSRETSSVKQRLDRQQAGYGDVDDSECQPLLPSGGSRSGANNEGFEKHGVGVATFFDSDSQRKEHAKHGGEHNRDSGSNKYQTATRSTYGSDQYRANLRDDANYGGNQQSSGSGRCDVYTTDPDLGATRKVTVPLGDDDSLPMESPATNEEDSPAPFSTGAIMKSSQYNSNDPTGLHVYHYP